MATMSTDETTKHARPQPLPAEQRAAILARYEAKGYKSLQTSDGVAFTCTLHRDGKPFLSVEQGGHGGPNTYHPASRLRKGGDVSAHYAKARANEATLRADARSWYAGSAYEASLAEAIGKTVEAAWPPVEVEDLLVSEVLDTVERCQWLMSKTRGGKRVLFQADDAIGSDLWRQFERVRPEHIQKAVEGAKKAGRRVRVVYRDGAGITELTDEVFGG